MKFNLQEILLSSSEKIYNGLFFLIVLFTFFLYEYPSIFDAGPLSIHNWRQSDSASMALCYFNEGLGFFTPKTHYGATGNVAIEFPIFYYLAAKLYEIFGPEDGILRVLHYLVLLVGIFFSGKAVAHFFNNTWIGLAFATMMLGCPLLAFYGFNFIPNTPALGLVLLSGFFYYQYVQTQHLGHYYGAILTTLLAGLIKPTIIIPFLAVMGTWGIYLLFQRKKLIDNPYFPSIPHILVGNLLVLGSCIGWIKWAEYYNNSFPYIVYFLRKPLPIYDISAEKINEIFDLLWRYTVPRLSSKSVFWFFTIGCVVNFIFIKKFPSVIRWFYLLTLLGTAAVFFLFFQQYNVHDYYLIDYMPFFLLSIVLTMYLIVEWAKKSSTKFRWIMLIFVIGTVLNVDTANRYLEHVYKQHYHAIANLAPAFQQQKELRQFMTDLGVNYHQEKPVIVIPDESPHFQLYKYNLRGFSFPPNEKMIAEVKLFVGFGCGPLIISDKRYLTEPLLQPFLTEPMGNFEEQIYVFKVNKSMVEEMEKSK